jgi:alpha-ketoglutarate-dependent 2,4-dichlorophenoxyacetate dioxygenase
MTLQIRAADPVAHPDFFGIVEGIDLSHPLAPADVAAIEAGMAGFAVLVFRDQRLTDEQQLAFTRHFGPLESALDGHIAKPEERRLHAAMADISNLDKDSRLLARDDRRRMFNLGNLLWHSDSSFKKTPAKYSLLSARVIPSAGGNTEFADMRAAYDALDPETQAEIEDLVCEHSLMYSRGQLGFAEFTEEERHAFTPVPQRLVRRHPTTGRKSLFLSSHAGTIQGWPMPEARAFLRDLVEHATQRRFVQVQRWQPFDLVMWDNRVTMHRARRYKENTEIRDLRRTTVQDIAPTLEQAA